MRELVDVHGRVLVLGRHTWSRRGESLLVAPVCCRILHILVSVTREEGAAVALVSKEAGEAWDGGTGRVGLLAQPGGRLNPPVDRDTRPKGAGDAPHVGRIDEEPPL